MIKILFILVLPFILNASKILSYNVYDRTDRVDVMITFDIPYSGKIKQSITQSKIIIKLEDAQIESSKLKQISSKFLQSLNITPMSGYTQIVATVPPFTKLRASKTSDAYGLRLRFSNKVAKKTKQKPQANTNLTTSLPTKKSGALNQSYYIVIAILIIGILILLYTKKKVTPNIKQKKQDPWLFKQNQQTNPISNNELTNEVTIRFQKSIDHDNNVVMLDFANQSYLVLMGKSNILLDKFTDNKPASQEDFEQILQNRHEQLDNFLNSNDNSSTKEPLQIYKEKAASISYEV